MHVVYVVVPSPNATIDKLQFHASEIQAITSFIKRPGARVDKIFVHEDQQHIKAGSYHVENNEIIYQPEGGVAPIRVQIMVNI